MDYRLGAIIPASNTTVEYELYRLVNYEESLKKNLSIHFSRIPINSRYSTNVATFIDNMIDGIPKAVKVLDNLDISSIGFFCTSASLYLNTQKTYENNFISIITPLNALISLKQKIYLKDTLLITPYDTNIGKEISTFFDVNSIGNIISNINLNLNGRKEFTEFGKNDLEQLIFSKTSSDIKNVIVLCTNIPTFHIINKIEERLKVNMFTSNQLLIWAMLQKISLNKNLTSNFGNLYIL